jgi:hypothetical protein
LFIFCLKRRFVGEISPFRALPLAGVGGDPSFSTEIAKTRWREVWSANAKCFRIKREIEITFAEMGN